MVFEPSLRTESREALSGRIRDVGYVGEISMGGSLGWGHGWGGGGGGAGGGGGGGGGVVWSGMPNMYWVRWFVFSSWGGRRGFVGESGIVG